MTQLSGQKERDMDRLWAKAVSTVQNGDFRGALFLFKKLEQEDCPEALVEIGNILELGGRGVSIDLSAAEIYYRKSASLLDDSASHLALGRLYLNRRNSARDLAAAKRHFEKVESKQPMMGAMFGLGLIYQFGLGTTPDAGKAKDYYRKAIKLGHILAERNLAHIRLRENVLAGALLWFKVCFKIFKAVLADPNDPRLTIRFDSQRELQEFGRNPNVAKQTGEGNIRSDKSY